MSAFGKLCCTSTGSFVNKSSVLSCENELVYFVAKEVLMKLIDSELTAISSAVSDVSVSALLEIIVAAKTMNVMHVLLLLVLFQM